MGNVFRSMKNKNTLHMSPQKAAAHLVYMRKVHDQRCQWKGGCTNLCETFRANADFSEREYFCMEHARLEGMK